jgi:hypothetical protein
MISLGEMWASEEDPDEMLLMIPVCEFANSWED